MKICIVSIRYRFWFPLLRLAALWINGSFHWLGVPIQKWLVSLYLILGKVPHNARVIREVPWLADRKPTRGGWRKASCLIKWGETKDSGSYESYVQSILWFIFHNGYWKGVSFLLQHSALCRCLYEQACKFLEVTKGSLAIHTFWCENSTTSH